jgi:hypothetical protein
MFSRERHVYSNAYQNAGATSNTDSDTQTHAHHNPHPVQGLDPYPDQDTYAHAAKYADAYSRLKRRPRTDAGRRRKETQRSSRNSSITAECPARASEQSHIVHP